MTMIRRDCCFLGLVGMLVMACVYTDPLFAQSMATSPTEIDLSIRHQEKSPLDRKISLQLDSVTVQHAIETIAREGLLRVSYTPAVLPSERRISLRAKNMLVKDAFVAVLKGLDLEIRAVDGSNLVLVRRGDREKPSMPDSIQRRGILKGRVVDSASGKGIAGVSVSVSDAKMSTVTKDGGEFTIANIPVGDHIVSYKLFGYRAVTKPLTIVSGTPAVVRVTLVATATQLSGIVTTATGQQRKIEIGSDVTQLNVPDIIKTMPVSNMSELLTTRVPGVDVVPTSGAPGAPSRIRIRGLSSVNGTNDPIVIVDGVRVYANQEPYARLSPIDQLDLNNVETVEVFKGPSAVALYGSEAANGVIVVTSKHGQIGAPRWSAQVIIGVEESPGKWPWNYWTWGHSVSDSTQIVHCLVGDQSCVQDSMVKYQLLNDPATTVFGRGLTQTYRADLSGGRSGMNYAFSVSSSQVLGGLKLSDVDVEVLRRLGKSVPAWQQQPQSDARQSGQLTLGFDIGRATSVIFTNNLTKQVRQSTALDDAIAMAEKMQPNALDNRSISDSLWGTGLLYAIRNFKERQTDQALVFRNSMSILTRLPYAITAEGTAGLELRQQQSSNKLGRGDCMPRVFAGVRNCDQTGEENGWISEQQNSNGLTNINLRVTQQQALGRWFSVRTSGGINYISNRRNGWVIRGVDIPEGANSPILALKTTQGFDRTVRNTAGGYFETVVGVADRFFFPLGMRSDAGNALGRNVTMRLPKVAWSYLVSEEPWFRNVPVLRAFSMFRPRIAFGHAGAQPKVGEGLRQYQMRTGELDGVVIPYATISRPGNTKLKPERTREIEGGLDAEIGDRLDFGLTWYHKKTFDALTQEPIASSVGFGRQNFPYNLGDVLNTGFEARVDGRIIETRRFRLQSTMSFSTNENRLLRLGVNDVTRTKVGGTTLGQNVVGYPLYGIWVQPIVAAMDKNGNGVVDKGEVILSDSAVYAGVGRPRYILNMTHNVMFGSTVTLATIFNYRDRFTQTFGFPSEELNLSAIRNDPTMSFIERASLASRHSYGATGTQFQTVSILRFSELSISVAIPTWLTRPALRTRQIHLALQGKNLGFWTNYQGKDPNVTSDAGIETLRDLGEQPTPRTWQLSVRIN